MNPSIIHDAAWTGETGRELRQHPADVREMFFYLLTSPDRNPFGLYLLETDLLERRIGLRAVPYERSLEILQSAGFCRWDPRSGWVWVIEMARIQFGSPLKAVDYRCLSAKKWYRQCPRNPFLGPWFDRYAADFHLAGEPNSVERRTHDREIEVMKGLGKGLSEAPVIGALKPLPQGAVSSPLVRTIGFDLKQEIIEQQNLIPADPATVPLTAEALVAAFEALWEIYPKGKEKAAALVEFRKLKPTPAFVEVLRASIIAHRTSSDWTRDNGQYAPRFVNFLKQKGWLDRVQPRGPVLSEKTQKNLAAASGFVERMSNEVDEDHDE